MLTLIAAFCDIHEIGPEFAWGWYILFVLADIELAVTR